MNFKVVKTGSKYPDVILLKDYDDMGGVFVEIRSYGTKEDIEDYFVSEQVKFLTVSTAKSFISDFSVESAEDWCKQQKVSY